MQTQQQNKYGYFGKITARVGEVKALASILLQASQMMHTVKGCLIYIVSRDSTDSNTIQVYEVWNSKEDHDNPLKEESTQQLIMQAMPLIDGKPEGNSLVILGGWGIN